MALVWRCSMARDNHGTFGIVKRGDPLPACVRPRALETVVTAAWLPMKVVCRRCARVPPIRQLRGSGDARARRLRTHADAPAARQASLRGRIRLSVCSGVDSR